MSFIFGKVGFVYSVFDNEDEEEQEDFFIDEIRYCNCFFDEFQYLIRKNNGRIGFKEIYDEFIDLPRKFRTEDFFCTIPSYRFFVVRSSLIFFVSLA